MPRLPFKFDSPTPAVPPVDAHAPAPAASTAKALTVSQLADLIKGVLSEHAPATVRVVGEVSNCSLRTHCFFSLKDQAAAVRCVCFATNLRRLAFRMADGMQVVVTGRLDYFPGQGNLQLYVDRIETVGQGPLELRLRQLMEELRSLGYFAPQRKKPLPVMPRKVAVVTSASGAALQDVINTASRRWPGCRLYLVDVRVQGPDAAPQIAHAINALSKRGPQLGIDGIILTRGGGSIEDLWAFNERIVADALFHCRLPVVAAIGHEVDTTIAELVADVRAATPTQAAMMLIPDAAALGHQIEQMSHRLRLLTQRQVAHCRQQLQAITRLPLFHQPHHVITPLRQRIDDAARRLAAALRGRARQSRQRLDLASARFHGVMPAKQSRWRHQLDLLAPRLEAGVPQQVRAMSQRLDALQRQMQAVNPHRVLQRGYSYTLGPDGRVLKRAVDASPGQRITTVLAQGRLSSTVDHPASIADPTDPVAPVVPTADPSDAVVPVAEKISPPRPVTPRRSGRRTPSRPTRNQPNLFENDA